MCVTGLTISNSRDGYAGNLSQQLSFRDEGKLCRACLKGTKAVTPARAAARILSLGALLAAVASALEPF